MIVYEQIFQKYGLSATQQEILKIVGVKKIILEVGASAGYMTRAFLDNGCIVDVVEKDPEAISKILKQSRKKFTQSIEDEKIYKLLAKDYDFIILADVLEHLVNPTQTLKSLLKVVSSKTKLLISMPNIACWMMRKQLFFRGDFTYQDSGLLDRTHLHFYTVETLPRLLSDAGFKVDKILGTITRLPLKGFIGQIPLLGWIFYKFLYPKLVNKFKNLAYYHFLIMASKK